jgi:putative drug exporter of the RND superfamily
MLLPASLELLGPITWRLPRWLEDRLPHFNIEGSPAHRPAPDEDEPAPTAAEPTSFR